MPAFPMGLFISWLRANHGMQMMQNIFKIEVSLLDRTAFAGQRPVKPLGIAATDQRLARSIPTLEMARGKLRRLMYSANELQP